MDPDESFLAEVAAALDAARLEALVVGMVAASLQGAPGATRDLDLLIRDTPRNRQKLEKFRMELGTARPAPVSPFTSTLRLEGGRTPVDIIFDRISGGLLFASLRARAVRMSVRDKALVVASLADVIRSKEAAGRPKDLAALPILRDTLRVREKLAKA